MKRIALSLIGLVLLLSSASAKEISPLLKTEWAQRGPYAAFTPGHERLGCWSVAIAQILFYHGLAPHGSTQYAGKSYPVSADFDHPEIDLKKVVEKLEKSDPKSDGSETARYLYFVAAVVGANFGPGGYIGNSDVRRQRLEKHFTVKTSRVSYPKSSQREVEEFITKELSDKRPLMLYIESDTRGEEGTGHAVVIDGVRKTASGFDVHLNFGWGGGSDGWHALWEAIKSEKITFNKPSRWVMAIKPK